MPTQLQLRRGTTVQHNTFTGVVGEVTINTTKKTAVVHDGSTAGGLELLRADMSNIFASAAPTITSLNTSGNVDVGGNLTVTGTSTFNGGTINLGDAAGDNVVFGADVNSSIIPNTDNTFNLGSAQQKWANLNVVDITQTGNTTTSGTLTVTGLTTLNGGLTLDSTAFTVADTTGNTSIGGTLGVTGDTTLTGDLAVNGGDLTTSQTTFNLLNTTATTLNIGGAATSLNLGAGTGTTTVGNNLTVTGNLTVSGTTTTVDSTTVNIQNAFVFEGATANDFETTLTTVDPTADRTISLPDATDTLVGKTTTDTLTNKSISLTTNTITGTLAEFNTALSDDNFVSLTGTETLTNKTLTTPVISSITNTGTLTLPTSTDTLVGRATTDTLTNKTLTSPKIGTSILDTNGNELLLLTATASAVNELTLANAAATNRPTISATGTDANIGISITPKGTGTIVVGSSIIPSTDITLDLGSASNRFRDLYISGNSIRMGSTKIIMHADGYLQFNSNSAAGFPAGSNVSVATSTNGVAATSANALAYAIALGGA